LSSSTFLSAERGLYYSSGIFSFSTITVLRAERGLSYSIGADSGIFSTTSIFLVAELGLSS
jgi:hypothetical protein